MATKGRRPSDGMILSQTGVPPHPACITRGQQVGLAGSGLQRARSSLGRQCRSSFSSHRKHLPFIANSDDCGCTVVRCGTCSCRPVRRRRWRRWLRRGTSGPGTSGGGATSSGAPNAGTGGNTSDTATGGAGSPQQPTGGINPNSAVGGVATPHRPTRHDRLWSQPGQLQFWCSPAKPRGCRFHWEPDWSWQYRTRNREGAARSGAE